MKKRLLILCLVTLILSACESSSAVIPISSRSALDSLPSRPCEVVEAYSLYNKEYTPVDVRNDVTITDTVFKFSPVWLKTPLEVDISDKENIKINGYSINWGSNPDNIIGEHSFRYSETDKHGYVAYSLRLPLDEKSSKQLVYAELYKQLRNFLRKAYDKSEIVLDTKTDFKRVIETNTPFEAFTAKWCYLWIEHSDLQFVIMNYYTQSQSSIDDFYYDD